MAKTTYIDILPENYDLYYKNLQTGDRFTNARIIRKSLLLSDAKKLDLAGRSLFAFLGAVWKTYDIALKNQWKSAAAKIGRSNWQLFIKDSANRIRLGLVGYAVPSDLHQAKVGQLHIESPATEIKIVQYHPDHYYISQKVAGKKGMRVPLMITEALYLPLELKLNYKSNLIAAGPAPTAKLYAHVHRVYQGLDLYDDLVIDLDLVTNWKSASDTLSSVVGLAVSYDLFIHLHDVTGDLWIDNVEANHSAQNWVRDPFCEDINEVFTKAFYQVPQHWAPITVPVGAEYESIYKDF